MRDYVSPLVKYFYVGYDYDKLYDNVLPNILLLYWLLPKQTHFQLYVKKDYLLKWLLLYSLVNLETILRSQSTNYC